MLLAIHIAAGGLAIVLGAIALLAKKGGNIHRRSGLLFVYAMLVLGATAALLGFRKSPTDGNVFGGLMTVYFVLTALMTVRAVSPWTRRINVAMLMVAVGLAVIDILGGVKAFNSPRGVLNGVPFPMHFFIAGVMILAAIGDVRIMLAGMPRGGPRLARHLWRMCFALFTNRGHGPFYEHCSAHLPATGLSFGPNSGKKPKAAPGAAPSCSVAAWSEFPPRQRTQYDYSGLFEISRRRTWPFHIQSPEKTIIGRKTYRVAGA
jgi:uncharacterized membrane protein